MPINANVTNNQITASVGETKIDVSVSGGVGPTGATGPQGPAGSLVMASASVLGGVRIGGGVSIDGNGVISVSTAYAASSHAHGFITASGTITDNAVNAAFVAAPAVVTTSGFLRQGEFGTTSGTICAGNDARLSDARQPLPHSHAAGDITSGTLSASLLPLASANTRGAVRIGTGITIDGAGVISATVSSLDWASITGKPSTFPPTLPTGTAGDVLTYVDGDWTAAAPSGGYDQSLNTTDAVRFNGLTIGEADSLTVDEAGNVVFSNGSISFGGGYDVDFDGAAIANLSYNSLTDLPTLGTAAAEDASAFVAATDSRLTDSREWSADTVSQAEAEAGTATTRRAWTAQRVFQAIAAWWGASAAKSKLDGIATGATANATDAQLRDRSTHTGTQTLATISDAGTAASRSVPASGNASSTDVVLGSDTRLTDSRSPTSHTHGNITNAGAIGSTGGLVVITTTGGVLVASPTVPVGAMPVATTSTPGAIIVGTGLYVTGGGALSAAVTSVNGQTGAVSIASYSLPAATSVTLGGVTVGQGLLVSGGNVSVMYGTTPVTACVGNDARLSDTRTPTAGSVTDSSITSGGLSASSINWVAIQPWAANTAYQKGDLVSNAGIAYRRSAAGTSGATFNTANWQQITPGEFSASQITSGVFATARLASSGTASSTTFLRGDGTWAAAGSTNASDLNQGTLANARMTTRARASMNLFLWSSFR